MSLLAPLLALALVAPTDAQHLIVLHTNDVHGQCLPRPATWLDAEGVTSGGLERLAAEVARIRAEAAASGAEVLVLDAGDWFQGTPEGSVQGGAPFVECLARIGYDAMAIGNHEFDLGVEHAAHLIEGTGVPAVCANVFERDLEGGWRRPSWAVPFRMVERAGLDVAVVGMVSPETPSITHRSARELRFDDPAETLTAVRAELPPETDLVIALTHDGVESDLELARAHPDLPLIVGGHSHSFLRTGLRQGETWIVQAGHKASCLGRVDLWLDSATGAVERSSARLIDLYEEHDPALVAPELRERVAELVAMGEAAMGLVVGELVDGGPEMGAFRSLPLGNWMADSMRRTTGADLGLHNRGGIRKRLQVGPLTRRDLFEVMPFDNTVVSLELTGAQVEAFLRANLDGRRKTSLEVSGMLVQLELADGVARFVRAWVDGRPIDPERTYRLATNSFLAEGGDEVFTVLTVEGGELVLQDTGILVREALEADLREKPRLVLPPESRYVTK